ncbi:MAG TPA: hypothetical protein GX529_04090 [Firmicutes bacterium]|nr:hypothetical protein [Candidatus Fermentithermobacillaceae bacterium]
MRRQGSRWPVFLFALAGVILAAAFISIARQGIPFESTGELHSRFTVAVKAVFLVCIALLGLFQNRVVEKRNR